MNHTPLISQNTEGLIGFHYQNLDQGAEGDEESHLTKTKTLSVSNYGKIGTVLIFFSICFFVLIAGFESIFFLYFGISSLIFYYFVALEYFYKIYIKKWKQDQWLVFYLVWSVIFY